MSPVRATCVPPHSSRELPMSSTRTSSPYFSPNSAIAPPFTASSYFMMRAVVGSFLQDLGVDLRLDRVDLLLAHRCVVREVESRLVGVDERALLLYVRPEHLAQRLVHQVRGRVVAHGAPAPRDVDVRGDPVAHLEAAGGERAVMAKHVGLDLLRVGDGEGAARGNQLARVAHLAARLGVERRSVEHDDRRLALRDLGHRGPFL